ncbi:MAG TPA: ABC transporter substrate binding protein [Paludibaculum sp.]|jgi:PAS domain S-box-containing protein
MLRRFHAPAAVLALCWLALACPGQDRPVSGRKEILILNSYHAGYNWTDELNRGLRSVLEAQRFETEIWVEYLDARRMPGDAHLAEERARLSRKYAGVTLDLVIASDDDATALLAEPGEALFAHSPVVFCGVSGMALVESLPRSRFTGLIEVFQLDTLLNRVLSALPRTSRIVVVTDNAPSNAAHRQMLVDLGKRRRELSFEYLDGARLSFEEILTQLRGVRPDALVIASAFTHDRNRHYLAPMDSGRRIAAASPAPVVSQNTSQLGQGYLIGNANMGYEHGQVAARMALRVLSGEPPGSIEIQRHGALQMLVDYAAMQRFGLSQSSLPEGTRIVNRPTGWTDFYASNPLLVWGALGFILLQSGIIAALFLNTSRRRRAEVELRSSQAQLQRSQEIARLGSWEREISTGKLQWSDEVYRIFGETPGSFDPSLAPMLGRVHPEDRERIRLLSKEADARHSDRAMEYRVVRPDGTIRHVQVQGKWVQLPDGRARLNGTVQDVTHLKEMEAHIQHALRVDSLGTLAGGIAHDFNNLLTVINGYCDLLLRKVAEDDPARRQILEIHHAGERAAELTGKLLSFSRKQVFQTAKLQINEVVLAMQGLLMPVVSDTIRLRHNLAPDLGTVLLDRTQLEHAILNLATNARDAMPDGGVLTISTSNEEIGAYQSSHGFQITPGPYVVLAVSDTGCGMDQATRDRIFEPFFTTKEVGKGTGLGLSTVYGMVQRSGGLVKVESEAGQGSTFRLFFPAAAPAQEKERIFREGERLPGGSERILLVEDEPSVRTLAAGTLRSLGYEVLSAVDGQKALQMLPDGAEPVQVLITDVIMPGMNGAELAARLEHQFPELRVLFVSGYSGGHLPADGLGAEAAFLAKPFLPAQLAGRVREVLAAPPRSTRI